MQPSERPRLHFRVENSLAIAVLAVMTLLPLIEIAGRVLVGRGISGSIVVVQNLTLWITVIGAVLAARSERLLGLSTRRFLPAGAQRPVKIFTSAVAVAVTATLVGFDQNMVRAGAILGAGPVRVFFMVTLPLILPGVLSGALFAFATSWDELIIVLFLATTEEHTIPRRMWSGIRELISPTIASAATILILLSIVLMVVMELLRRRGERLRGITG